MRALVLGLGLVLLVATLGALPSSADEKDRLTYTESGYVVLDPARVRSPNDERLVLALYDGLTAIDGKTGEIVPAAAERWEEAPDGKSWTFHLQSGATWSDGKPVLAKDFVEAWKRLLDPYEPSPWAHLLRPLKGCTQIDDGVRGMNALSATSKGLKALLDSNPAGIPGSDLKELLERTAVRRYAEDIDDASVKKMLRWGSDPFPKDRVEQARDAIKKERRKWKKRAYGAYDAFGITVGAKMVDSKTLVVLLEGRCPYLPALVARAPLVPLHEKSRGTSETAFAPEDFRSNGAYLLKDRGAKARPDVPNPTSAVHLVRRKDYKGLRPGTMQEILCFTDLGRDEDIRRLEAGTSQWMANPDLKDRKELVKMAGFKTRPAGRVVLLRFRCDKKPFDNEDARRAFALAVDRKRLARELWPEPDEAMRLVPGSGMAGPSAPATDLGGAKAALSKAGLKADKFPWIELQVEDLSRILDVGEDLLRQWEKGLGIEMGLRLETITDARRARQAGAYHLSIGVLDGAVQDPAAWVLTLGGDHPDGALGWDDEGFQALLDAAADVDGLIAGGDAAVQKLPGADALRATVGAAKRGGAERERLRVALLDAAERRALEACVVVPLLWPKRASVEKSIKDLGCEAAWRRPAFYGDLRRARR